jgi:hypothetical protein
MTLAGVGAAAAIALETPSVAAIAAGHQPVPVLRLYQPYTPGGDERPDPPHTPEPDATFWAGYSITGTAPTTRVDSSGSVSYGYGPNVLPNVFGD